MHDKKVDGIMSDTTLPVSKAKAAITAARTSKAEAAQNLKDLEDAQNQDNADQATERSERATSAAIRKADAARDASLGQLKDTMSEAVGSATSFLQLMKNESGEIPLSECRCDIDKWISCELAS